MIKNGVEILGGGATSINYADLTYNPNVVNPNAPIYNNWNNLYTAIQNNMSKSLITRLWFDDRVMVSDYDSSWNLGFFNG